MIEPPAPQRLQKVISAAGLMSRRAAESLIGAGRVTIDGRPAKLGDRVDPTSQRVEVDGVLVPIAPDRITYLLFKPVGVVSTADDPEGRPTVTSLVPELPRVVPVGRLDIDSEGLILLSNDGELTLRVTHPRYRVTKTYLAEVTGKPTNKALAALRAGVELDDGVARALRVRIVGGVGDRSLVELILAEGRNREVRRMLAAVGYPVLRLVRTAIGPLTDPKLKPGKWRQLSPAEVSALYRAAELPATST
jgi:23S rRNA pseudouridine2605 synthase